MLHIAIQIRDLISSNVSSAVEGASNPVKMLKLLRGEIEEAVIALTGDQGRIKGRQQQLLREVAELDLREADWSDKAASAMKSGREDLARTALLERERLAGELAQRQTALKDADAQLADIAEAIAALEAKHAETCVRLAEAELSQRHQSAAQCVASASSGLGAVDRKLHRIETLERRVDFSVSRGTPPVAAAAEAEIAALELEQKVSAELDKLRAKAAGGKGKR